MEKICCAYYDEEQEQDCPFEPTLDEAITAFRGFCWENIEPESPMKSIYFQTSGEEQAALMISSLNKGHWDVGASAYTPRRYLGPFFKKKTHQLFLDLCASEVENLINKLFVCSLAEYASFLNSYKTP